MLLGVIPSYCKSLPLSDNPPPIIMKPGGGGGTHRKPHVVESAQDMGVTSNLLLAQDPGEEKFRRIKRGNAAFQQRLAFLPASLDFLKHVGFLPDAEGAFLCLAEEKATPPLLSAAGELLSNAINNPMFGVL